MQTKMKNKKPVKLSIKMVNEQTNASEYIVQAIAKAARVTVQTRAMAGTARAANPVTRMSRPIMKQHTFDWSAKDNYAELRNFKLDVKTHSKTLI